MSYAKLIEQRLLTLSEAKQAEVFDFVEFLATRNQAERNEDQVSAKSALNNMMRNPLKVNGFTPLSREEANAR
jgi:erythromycin esterase-like protein